jgi:hypothetical protein
MCFDHERKQKLSNDKRTSGCPEKPLPFVKSLNYEQTSIHQPSRRQAAFTDEHPVCGGATIG